ncbi:MAG: hypothetical protein EON59_00100 [Alphaproteobacteria bacterium]|nr:MAG: hypothetical protein EON59_00100 [Alphaproteobacteria bacterium]
MLWVVLGRALQFLLMFGTLKVSTALLPPEEMAKVYLLTSTVLFFSMMFVNPVGMFVNRRLHDWNDSRRARPYFVWLAGYVIGIACGAATLVMVLMHLGWLNPHTSTSWACVIVSGTLISITFNQTTIPALNLLGAPKAFILLTVATTATSLAFGASLAMSSASPQAEHWMAGLLLGQFGCAILGGVLLRRRCSPPETSPRLSRSQIGILFSFAWPLSIAVGLNWIQFQGYRFLVESAIGLHGLGLFVAGYSISMGLLSAFETILTSILQPRFYRGVAGRNANEQAAAWRDYSTAIVPSSLIMAALIAATAQELTRVLLGSAYAAASQFVVWGACAEFLRIMAAAYGMSAHATMRTGTLLVPGAAGALISLSAAWLLLQHWGVHGVGAALSLAALVNALLTILYTRPLRPLAIPMKPLSIGAIAGGIVLVTALAIRPALPNSTAVVASLVLIAVLSVPSLATILFLLRLKFEHRHD